MSKFDDKNVEGTPFLRGLTLNPESITWFTPYKTYILLIHGVEPRESLLAKVLNSFEQVDYVLNLYRLGYIDITRFQRYFTSYEKHFDLNILLYILKNPSEFEGIDTSLLFRTFIKVCDKYNDINKLSEIILQFCKLLPGILSENFGLLSYKCFNTRDSGKIFRQKSEAFLKDIFKNCSFIDILGIVHDNSNYAYLIKFLLGTDMSMPDILGYQDNAKFQTDIDNCLKMMIEGQYPYIAFAMLTVQELKEKTTELVNGWIEEGKELELDIYANALITRKLTTKLDDEYIAALQGVEPEKPLRIEPKDQDGQS